MKVKTKQEYRKRRHLRIRRRVRGTSARPRMHVFVSNRHLYVQFIDDDAAQTLAAVSTSAGELKALAGQVDVEAAKKVGQAAAAAAQAKGIGEVIFDRGGFRYAGRIKALAESARAAGLKF